MKSDENLLSQLVQAFKILPGIGEKSAQRMAFYLLEKNREGGSNLAKLISASVETRGIIISGIVDLSFLFLQSIRASKIALHCIS